MSTVRDDRIASFSPRRWAWWGFVVGAAITVPATLAALLFRTAEALHPFLVPSGVLLRPLSEAAATWPGAVNVAIAAVVNGLIYAAGAAVLALLLDRGRRGDRP